MLYLDTNVTIGLIHGDFELENLISTAGPDEKLAIVSISMYEIYAGLYTMQYPEALQKE